MDSLRTFLPGDSRGWRKPNKGTQLHNSKLKQWHVHRLIHPIETLSPEMRNTVAAALEEIREFRGWKLWAHAVRSNHIHVVISAEHYKPDLVRDQLKSKATRNIREAFPLWRERPVWSAKGDIEFLDSETEIEQCTLDVDLAQDRKCLDEQ